MFRLKGRSSVAAKSASEKNLSKKICGKPVNRLFLGLPQFPFPPTLDFRDVKRCS
jgi:hypothetical protein